MTQLLKMFDFQTCHEITVLNSGISIKSAFRSPLAPLDNVYKVLKAKGVNLVSASVLARSLEKAQVVHSVTVCKGENLVQDGGRPWITPRGVYQVISMLTRNIESFGPGKQQLLNRCAASIPDISELRGSCQVGYKTEHITRDIAHLVRKLETETKRNIEYRIASARDEFNMPAFGEDMSDREVAAVIITGKFSKLKNTLLDLASRAELAEKGNPSGFSAPVVASVVDKAFTPSTGGSADLDWMS